MDREVINSSSVKLEEDKNVKLIQHPNISYEMRSVLFSWLKEISTEIFSENYTNEINNILYLTYYYIDLFVKFDSSMNLSSSDKYTYSKTDNQQLFISDSNYQLLGCVCFLIVIKLQHNKVLRIKDILEYCGNRFNENQYLRLEVIVIRELICNLYVKIPLQLRNKSSTEQLSSYIKDDDNLLVYSNTYNKINQIQNDTKNTHEKNLKRKLEFSKELIEEPLSKRFCNIHSRFDDLYTRTEFIGEGSYAYLYKGFRNSDKKIVAIKRFKSYYEESIYGIDKNILRECSNLTALNDHLNIISLLDIIIDSTLNETRIYMVLEYIPLTLYDVILRDRNPKLAKYYLYQLLKALEYIHSKGIIHRDLKHNNILVDGYTLKIIDFGLSKNVYESSSKTLDVFCFEFKAPEILLGDIRYSSAVDIWATGVLFSYMLNNGSILINEKTEIEQLKQIFKYFGTPDKDSYLRTLPNYTEPSEKCTARSPFTYLDYSCPLIDDLFSKMMKIDPTERITASEALLHPLFDELNKKED